MTDGPLQGLRVVDLSTMISGGFATVMLADFGADVISVEHPEYGDPVRTWEPKQDGTSMWWKSLGRNQRHVTLNLSEPEGQAVAQELAADADILIENFRPGTLERWNLAPEQLREENEGLIVTRISGYGQTGPYSGWPGFGTVAESLSTFAHQNGFPDTTPLLPPIPIADLTAGMFAVMASMYAVYERDVGGSETGQVVDVSLYEPLFRLMTGDPEAYDTLGHVSKRTGNVSPNAAPRNLYETRDSYISLSASTQRIFENVMKAIEREDLIEDDRFNTNEKRVENREELDEIIEGWTSERTRETVLQRMRTNDAIVGPIYDIADAFDDEHFQARNDLHTVEDEELGPTRTHAPVPRFSRTPGEVDHLAGDLGEHNHEVYRNEVGLSEAEFDRLVAEGII